MANPQSSGKFAVIGGKSESHDSFLTTSKVSPNNEMIVYLKQYLTNNF